MLIKKGIVSSYCFKKEKPWQTVISSLEKSMTTAGA